MRFAHPNMLFLLLVLPPALIVFFWWAWNKRQQLMTRFIQARLLPYLTLGISPGRQKFRMACLVAATVCLILALARLQWGFDWEEVKQRGLDIVVAIDTSKSMLAKDVAPNRLARAKLAALDLMQQAKSDRLGLVAFAGGAFLQCPLTIDDSAFRRSVDDLSVKTIPQGGTALAEAIQAAQTAFKEGDNHRVLVLMTDGEDHDSGALDAAKKAADAGMRIYTIGIGSAEGDLLTFADDQGHTDYVRDEQGNVVKSHLNEDLLRQIASATGGFYLPLRGAKTIDTLFEHPQGLASLPKSESSEKLVKQYHERYHWPLGVAVVLLLIEMLLPESKRKKNDGGSGLRPVSNSRKSSRSLNEDQLAEEPGRTAMSATVLRTSNARPVPLINTGALARCLSLLRPGQLFQQFGRQAGKPLKRLYDATGAPHRAKAPVLMKDSPGKGSVVGAAVSAYRAKASVLMKVCPGSTWVVSALMMICVSATASPSSALREYKAGDYDRALKDYEKLLEKQKDDPRLHFNAGAAAYRDHQFDEAAKQFGEALNSPDLNLQQQAYYNLGNALYYLGENNSDSEKRSKSWEQSAQNFESTMKLNPKDNDAKFNYEFVKKKLEELKQQQQQQQKSNQDKKDQNQNQDQNQQQQQQNKENQDKKDQNSQQQQQQSQQEQQKDKEQQQAQQKQDQQSQAQQAEKSKEDKQKEQQQANQASGQQNDKANDKEEEQQQAYAAGEMTPQQAKQLLDAQKGEEMMLPIKPEGKPQDTSKPIKDW